VVPFLQKCLPFIQFGDGLLTADWLLLAAFLDADWCSLLSHALAERSCGMLLLLLWNALCGLTRYIIRFPLPTHSFIPGLKPYFFANPSHHSLSFSTLGLTTWILQTFTVTSEHIRFYLLFLCFTLFICPFRAVD